MAGTHADDAHLPGCAHCQAEFDKFAEVVTIARRPGPGWKPALARPAVTPLTREPTS
jgi:hypothetical protein